MPGSVRPPAHPSSPAPVPAEPAADPADRVELTLYISPTSPPSLKARRNMEKLLQDFRAAEIGFEVLDRRARPGAGGARQRRLHAHAREAPAGAASLDPRRPQRSRRGHRSPSHVRDRDRLHDQEARDIRARPGRDHERRHSPGAPRPCSLGKSGTGKTILALHAAAHLARTGHKVILLVAEESPADLIHDRGRAGLRVHRAHRGGDAARGAMRRAPWT